MTTQTIEVEGLPEGWKAVAYRYAYGGEYVHTIRGIEQIRNSVDKTIDLRLIVEKIQPRRIVLEEISKEEYYRLFHDERCTEIYNLQGSYWKQVKETDIPLNSEEPKLSLNVSEVKTIFGCDFALLVKIENSSRKTHEG